MGLCFLKPSGQTLAPPGQTLALPATAVRTSQPQGTAKGHTLGSTNGDVDARTAAGQAAIARNQPQETGALGRRLDEQRRKTNATLLREQAELLQRQEDNQKRAEMNREW